jgi:hypothetical protein
LISRVTKAAFFDELEKIALAKPKFDPIRGRPIGAVKVRAPEAKPLLPVVRTWNAPDDDLSYAVSEGMV